LPREANEQALQAFLSYRDPLRLLTARTEIVDSLVSRVATECLKSTAAAGLGVAAVGGYGRRELFPYSDVDILLLAANESDLAGVKGPVSEFLRVLWDSGFRVSHSVRTVAECSRLHEQNTELHISLLDLRFLSGNRLVFDDLSQRLPEVYRRYVGTLTPRLVDLGRQRHTKFNDTVYHLEPNIKEAPGGIRDVHLLRWLGQLLPQHAAIRESLRELESAKEFLFALRCFLHIQAGRDNNLLSFEQQDEAARTLAREPIAPEAWMRLYFQHARSIFQSSLRALEFADSQDAPLLRQFRDWRGRLSTSEFTVSRERVFLRNATETLGSSESVLRLFSFLGRHGVRLSWDAQRRLRNDLENLTILFRRNCPSWPVWRELFSQPHAAVALQEMQETGLLAAAIPEWQSIDSLVVRDFYHRYTVDEHTLVAIQTVDRLVANEVGTPHRFYEFVLGEDEQTILRLALLLHDIGKGTHPGDHVRGSLEGSKNVMQRLHAPEPIQQAVLFLIEHHLDLSLIMNGRDLDDTATARFLTSRIGTQEDLRRLTLLTYADISAVNPTAMTPWRLEQLWRTYCAGAEQLTRELATERIHESPGFVSDTAGSEKLAGFLEGFPKRYLRTHTREQVEHHFALAQKSKREGVAVEISREAGVLLMTVLAHDKPGLFASLCGALASFGMNIVKAEAASNNAGYILDQIRFTDPMRTLELNPDEINRVQWTVECVVKGTIDVADLLKRRRAVRRTYANTAIAPIVHFNDDASDAATLIDFVAEDRPGLLYDLASTISARGCNIEVVMIDTEAHKAIDVFYVTRNNRKLSESMQERLGSDLKQAATARN
jgi:[protein-PII] uridylyltransferase